MNYVGAAQKLTEAQLALLPIQMGARVYLPGFGRFLQVDPVQGGTPNNYVYPPEPVNNYDLTGTIAPLIAALAPVIGRVAVGAAVKIATSYGGKKVAQKAVTKGVAKGATKTATKSTAQQKYQAGMQGAKQVQNTTRVNSALTQGKYRVPDGLTKSTITEVKNVKYQAYTSQLRDYSAIAKRDGLQFTLKVNNGAGLSGPLRQAESDEFLKIIGY
jgi:RHS repeat-associated protein